MTICLRCLIEKEGDGYPTVAWLCLLPRLSEEEKESKGLSRSWLEMVKKQIPLFTTINTIDTVLSYVRHRSHCLFLIHLSFSHGPLQWDTNELCMLILGGVSLSDFLNRFTHICLFSYHHSRTVPVALHFKSVVP